MKRPLAVDLFSGAGGATAGLVAAGCEVKLAVECNEDARQTYAANFPAVKLLPDLIEEYTPRYLRDAASVGDELAILTACPPCQGFSTLGKCDPEDERNDYVLMLPALVEALHPKAVIVENVPGLANDVRLSRVKESLTALGYGVNSWVVNATDFCVPQSRKRLVLLAVFGLEGTEISDPRDDYDCTDWPSHPHTVREVLKEVGAPNETDAWHRERKLPPQVLERVRAVPNDGGSRWDLPQNLRLDCHSKLTVRNAGSVYGRMWWNKPAPTITTRCTTPACGRFLHPEENRPITVREAATFQSFPEDYKWFGGAMSVARQIGNAVPVRFAEMLARHALTLIASEI